MLAELLVQDAINCWATEEWLELRRIREEQFIGGGEE